MNRSILRRASFTLALIWTVSLLAGTAMAQAPGQVWAWGTNSQNQLGNGTGVSTQYAVQSWGLSTATAISAGGAHTLALKADGTVSAWGNNDDGQLGNGTFFGNSTPSQVLYLSGVVAVAAGARHSLALKANGQVIVWGANNTGQLGDGTNAPNTVPGPNYAPSRIVAIAAGDNHSLAIERYSCPVADPGFLQSAVEKTEQTEDVGVFPTCTRVLAWGDGTLGQLGNGTNDDTFTPVIVSGLSNVVAIAAGFGHSLALKADGTVWAWGYNIYGHLGNGTYNPSNVPVQVVGINNAAAIAAGAVHSMALRSDGTVSAWGSNGLGQLGNGTYNSSNVPVTTWLFPPIVGIAAGPMYSLGLRADGKVFAWGWNYHGTLGNSGAGPKSNIPVPVTNLSGAVRISAGATHAVAITNPLASVNPTSLSFGSTAAGSMSAPQNVTLTNLGPDPMIVSNLAIVGANPADFTVTALAQPTTLAVNSSMTVAVRFTPTANGIRTASLRFTDTGFKGPHLVSLSGSAYTPALPADMAIGQSVVQVDKRLTYTIQMRNYGPGSATSVTFNGAVPYKTELVSIDARGCVPNSRLGPLACTYPSMASGAQNTITLVVDVIVDEPVQIDNTVVVSSATSDPEPGNNSSTLVTDWDMSK
jgi:uncharacterized repeat protein (TIGR01451 family)